MKMQKDLIIINLGVPIFEMERTYNESKCHGKE